MKLIAGPWIGDIKQELFTFRPYVMWLYSNIRRYCTDFYVSSHQQHQFLYDLPDITYIPVDHELSEYEDCQGIINNTVSNKDYLVLIRKLKNTIEANGETIHCYVKYTKHSNFVIPISKKMFTRVNIPFIKNDNIVSIDTLITYGIDGIESIKPYVSSREKIERLLGSRMVFCPCGVWTFFCNLHGIPVYSWGDEGISMYKPGGVYHFNNPSATIVNIGDKKLISTIKDLARS